MSDVHVLAIDLAKRSFRVCGTDRGGAVLFNRALTRAKLMQLLGAQEPCIVAMEAGATSPYWGRLAQRFGQDFRLVPPIYVKPFVKRTIEETVSTDYIGYWATIFGVTVDYDLRPNIKLTSSFSYTIADYKKTKSAVGVTNRSDDYITFEIGLRYLPTENFFIGPSYQFSSRNSNLPDTDFGRHLFSIRIGAQL